MTWIPRAVPKPAPTPPKARKRPTAKRRTPRRIQGIKCPELVAWIHTQSCEVCAGNIAGDFPAEHRVVEASHMPESKRFGDWENVIPLCAWHHRIGPHAWHRSRSRFYRTWAIAVVGNWAELASYTKADVVRVARLYTEQFVAKTGFRPPEVR